VDSFEAGLALPAFPTASILILSGDGKRSFETETTVSSYPGFVAAK
jgi:hypothetical protein